MDRDGLLIEGWMTEGELEWLRTKASGMRAVVEIGAWKGRSTYALCASGCPLVYAVDHFRGSIMCDGPGAADASEEVVQRNGSTIHDFWRNVGHFDNLRLLAMSSAEAAQILNGKVTEPSMVFIDGSHDEGSVQRDLMAWSHKPLRPSLICGHDYHYPSVRRAVENFYGAARVSNPVDNIWEIVG